MVLRGAMVFQNTIAPFQHKCNRKPSTAPCGRKGEISMDCTQSYKEHIMYSFNGFCRAMMSCPFNFSVPDCCLASAIFSPIVRGGQGRR